jgi:hypothetical protein
LVDEFLDISYSTATHEGIGAALVCYLHSHAIEKASNQDWRSFNLSRWEAVKQLDEIKRHLLDYDYNDNTWPVQVRTPGNTLYVCAEDQIRRSAFDR